VRQPQQHLQDQQAASEISTWTGIEIESVTGLGLSGVDRVCYHMSCSSTCFWIRLEIGVYFWLG
jgi:hypothetical protein